MQELSPILIASPEGLLAESDKLEMQKFAREIAQICKHDDDYDF